MLSLSDPEKDTSFYDYHNKKLLHKCCIFQVKELSWILKLVQKEKTESLKSEIGSTTLSKLEQGKGNITLDVLEKL